MSKRRLKRQLNLLQVIMLGTAGTIAAEVFVLTGHAAALSGPAVVLAVVVAGLLSYSIALNYCELASMYPVTGGALTYVREAWGTNLLSFLVGSLDCLSSTFYSALSAVGFAYSLRVFVPGLPVVPIALAAIAVFVLLNLLGVSQVGNAQTVLGGGLLIAFAVYIVAGLLRPNGFSWSVLAPGGSIFVGGTVRANTVSLLATVALVYNAFVGFEVIADDAEEVSDPRRNIPRAILISLTVITLIYVLTILVTLGTVPWQELAGSSTALTDAVGRFLPRFGVPMMAAAGIVATLTSVNSAMLSATREALTLSRDGLWPRALSKLNHLRVPYVAVLAIGLVVAGVAAIGVVDFLSYISSSGYLFVLFWSNLALVRLRQRYPEAPRSFKVPWFPLTAYVAAGSCLLIIAFTQGRALLFGVGILAVCSVYYFSLQPLRRLNAARTRTVDQARDRILVPVASPLTARSLMRIASIVARASQDASVCMLTVVESGASVPEEAAQRLTQRLAARRHEVMTGIASAAQAQNVPVYTKLRAAPTIADGILAEGAENVRLLLMGWPGRLDRESLPRNAVKVLLRKAEASMGVLLDRGLGDVHRILVPVGGGPHARLGIRLAYEIARAEGAQVTALYCQCELCDVEQLEDRMLGLREVIEDELGQVPPSLSTRVVQTTDVVAGVLQEAERMRCDLIVMGASEEYQSPHRLFGTISDSTAEQAPCSVLLVRRHEHGIISWIRRQSKGLNGNGNGNGGPTDQGRSTTPIARG